MAVTRFTSVGDIALHYIIEGQPDGPALVFINSLGSDLRIWDALIPQFSSRYLTVRYDKRGHGLSDCPPAPYTIRDHTRDLARLLDALQIQEALLVGISVGGMIALDFATAYRGRVKGLVLCDTAPKIGTESMWNERINTLREHGMEYLGDAILERWFAPSFVKERPADYRGYYNMLTRMPVDGYTGTCEAIRDADLRASVKGISAQSLVLCGAGDASTPPDLVQELADTLPDARFALIQQAAHLPCIEQPDAMAVQINNFLEEIGYV